MTTDHVGYNTKYARQSFEDRTIWVVYNQGLEQKYMFNSYDGFVDK